MTLPILVAQEQWQEFDQGWKELIEREGDVGALVVALRLAGEKKRISRCMPMAKEHASALETAGRHADAARVLGAALVAGGNPGELSGELLRHAREAWGSEPWWEAYSTMAGLGEGGDLRGPWQTFAKLLTFRTGGLVHHAGGWGVGEVLDLRPEKLEIEVRFWSGKRDVFPLAAAVEIFDALEEHDLKAQHYRDPEGLRARAKKDPLEVLRTVVEAHHGRATTALIRNALMGIGIEGSAWSAWWRKARKLAENSEWFEVTGSQQKAVVRLLLRAKDPAEGLQRHLELAGSLGEVLAKVRELFIGEKVEPRLKEVGLQELEKAAEDESAPLLDRVGAWLLIREQRKQTPAALRATLETLVAEEPPGDPSIPPALWKLLQELPSVRDQERSVELLAELYGDAWVDEAAQHLTHAAPGMVRLLVDALHQRGRDEDLQRHYAGLLARPLRAPALLTTLARMFEGKPLPSDFPNPSQRAHALLTLANHLFEMKRGNAHLTRVHGRMVEILASGRKPILLTLLADADAASLRSLQAVVQRGVDPAIDHVITDIALSTDRQFFASQFGPFWAGDMIWTTRAGLERRSAELRELREVKIPANQEAIGRAASFGDLSENSEWEAAIEEQRTLTNRAMEIEEELRRVELLENAAMPEGVVCPGMLVRYRETATGQENTVAVLGPWDDHLGDHIISYRAPLAAGLLGHRAGERVQVKLPSGEIEVEVLEVEPTEYV